MPATECLAVAPDDATHRWVVRGNIDLDGITRNDPYHPPLAHLPRCAGGHFVACFQLHTKCGIGQCLDDNTFGPEVVILTCDESLLSIRRLTATFGGTRRSRTA